MVSGKCTFFTWLESPLVLVLRFAVSYHVRYVYNVIRLKLFFQHFLADSGVFRAVGHHLVRVHADRLPPLGIQDTGRGARSAGSQHFGQQEKGNQCVNSPPRQSAESRNLVFVLYFR